MGVLNNLDIKLLEHFRGYVVKKDLVRSVKVGANVPVFVLEYLIANSCSTDDEEKIRIGMENVKRVLSEHYVNPEESTLIHSKIRENGHYKIIDKISPLVTPSARSRPISGSLCTTENVMVLYIKNIPTSNASRLNACKLSSNARVI